VTASVQWPSVSRKPLTAVGPLVELLALALNVMQQPDRPPGKDAVLAPGPPPVPQLQVSKLAVRGIGGEGGEPVPVDVGEPQSARGGTPVRLAYDFRPLAEHELQRQVPVLVKRDDPVVVAHGTPARATLQRITAYSSAPIFTRRASPTMMIAE
jgi:hypothetical protein